MIQQQEAADALREIARAEQHSGTAYRYHRASPHLFLWGFIWIVGYAVGYARPQWHVFWAILTVLGFLGSFFISWRARTRDSRTSFGWRYAATFVAMFLFVEALFAILPPQFSLQIDAFFPLLIALWYALLGIWTRGTRIALLGFTLGALTVGGYFSLHHYFDLWMAAVGGGALILGGFWLRRV
jgi:phosphatidylglycerophosphate synthase